MALRQQGSRVCWLAVKSGSQESATRLLGIQKTEVMGKGEGFAVATQSAEIERIFITPAHEGWVLLYGRAIQNMLATKSVEVLEKLVSDMGLLFGSACLFAIHETKGLNCWIFAEDGQLRRSFYRSASGKVLAHRGAISESEIDIRKELVMIGLPKAVCESSTSTPEDEEVGKINEEACGWFATESQVFSIAEARSIAPFWFDGKPTEADFLVGHLDYTRLENHLSQAVTAPARPGVSGEMVTTGFAVVAGVVILKVIKEVFFSVPL